MTKKTFLIIIALIIIGVGGFWIYQSEVPVDNNGYPNAEEQDIIFCVLEQRNVDVCFQLYDPVCAKVNIQCFTTPCDPIYQTFSNPCEACKNPLVESYTKAECVSGD